jgi:DNA-binding transcriptional MerR regulator
MSGMRIKTVVRLTGLSPERLRAWERRHGVVQPRRTPGGYREYSDADVHKLRLLRSLTERGFAISEIAPLGLAELDEIANRADAAAVPSPRRRSVHAERLLVPAVALDARELGRALRRTLALLPAGEVIIEALLPLVDELSRRTRRDPDQGLALALVAAEIRGLLGTLAAEIPPDADVVLLAPDAAAPPSRCVEAWLACLAAGRHVVCPGPADEHSAGRARALGAHTVLLVCAADGEGHEFVDTWAQPPRVVVFGRTRPPGIPAVGLPDIASGLALIDVLGETGDTGA